MRPTPPEQPNRSWVVCKLSRPPIGKPAHMPSRCRMKWAVGLTNVDVTDLL